MKTSEAQLNATRKWNKAHKSEKNYLRAKSAAKTFILKKATDDDIFWLKDLIKVRESHARQISKFGGQNSWSSDSNQR